MAVGFIVLPDIVHRVLEAIANQLRHPSRPFQLTVSSWQQISTVSESLPDFMASYALSAVKAHCSGLC